MNRITELNERIEQAKAQFREQGKQLLFEEAKLIFAKYPKAASVNWTQYTPYFNDGSPCDFGVESGCGGEYDGKKYHRWGSSSDPTEVREFFGEMSALISAIDEDVMKAVFGDHVIVTLAADGSFSTEEYDEHD